jgi:hypothetical protein
MSEDLVKQARAWDFCWPSKDIQRLVPAMADRIEELEAKLAKAVEALEYYAVEALPWEADDSLMARKALAELKSQGDGFASQKGEKHV